MRLELHYRSDVDLSQPAMQVEIRNHIARCLRNHPHGDEGVITLAGVELCFVYVVHDDAVDTVIGAARLHRAGRKRASAGRDVGWCPYRLVLVTAFSVGGHLWDLRN
jgi:hypothetical protein